MAGRHSGSAGGGHLLPLSTVARHTSNEGKEQREAWLDTGRRRLLAGTPGSSYPVPPAPRSWTWSAWTGLWWGLSWEGEELKEQGQSFRLLPVRHLAGPPLTFDLCPKRTPGR